MHFAQYSQTSSQSLSSAQPTDNHSGWQSHSSILSGASCAPSGRLAALLSERFSRLRYSTSSCMSRTDLRSTDAIVSAFPVHAVRSFESFFACAFRISITCCLSCSSSIVFSNHIPQPVRTVTQNSATQTNINFFIQPLPVPSVSEPMGKREGAIPRRIPSEALEKPWKNHERKCALSDAFTPSRLSVKFSRFHSSLQCDERTAVELSGDIIADSHRQWRVNPQKHRNAIQLPRASFREKPKPVSLTTNSYLA